VFIKFFGEFQGGVPHIKTKETYINERPEMSGFFSIVEILYSTINTLNMQYFSYKLHTAFGIRF